MKEFDVVIVSGFKVREEDSSFKKEGNTADYLAITSNTTYIANNHLRLSFSLFFGWKQILIQIIDQAKSLFYYFGDRVLKLQF